MGRSPASRVDLQYNAENRFLSQCIRNASAVYYYSQCGGAQDVASLTALLLGVIIKGDTSLFVESSPPAGWSQPDLGPAYL